MISVYQKLPATHCVVIVVLQRVSATHAQSQCQGVVAEDQKQTYTQYLHIYNTIYLLPLHCSEVMNPTVTDSSPFIISIPHPSHYH